MNKNALLVVGSALIIAIVILGALLFVGQPELFQGSVTSTKPTLQFVSAEVTPEVQVGGIREYTLTIKNFSSEPVNSATLSLQISDQETPFDTNGFSQIVTNNNLNRYAMQFSSVPGNWGPETFTFRTTVNNNAQVGSILPAVVVIVDNDKARPRESVSTNKQALSSVVVEGDVEGNPAQVTITLDPSTAQGNFGQPTLTQRDLAFRIKAEEGTVAYLKNIRLTVSGSALASDFKLHNKDGSLVEGISGGLVSHVGQGVTVVFFEFDPIRITEEVKLFYVTSNKNTIGANGDITRSFQAQIQSDNFGFYEVGELPGVEYSSAVVSTSGIIGGVTIIYLNGADTGYNNYSPEGLELTLHPDSLNGLVPQPTSNQSNMVFTIRSTDIQNSRYLPDNYFTSRISGSAKASNFELRNYDTGEVYYTLPISHDGDSDVVDLPFVMPNILITTEGINFSIHPTGINTEGANGDITKFLATSVTTIDGTEISSSVIYLNSADTGYQDL